MTDDQLTGVHRDELGFWALSDPGFAPCPESCLLFPEMANWSLVPAVAGSCPQLGASNVNQ
jgi:hypothetical protein